MHQTIAILGRQPSLGLAELESLYGAGALLPFGGQSCLIDIAGSDIDFQRLGGTIRLAKVLTELPSTNWNDIEKYLLTVAPEHASTISGKLSFGISVFGLKVDARKIAKTALLLKKAIKSSGVSVRMVPHQATELGSATVLYNKLTSKNGWELLIISDGKTAILAQTIRIQDIDAYSARDQARPFRDAKVGMLPPKLAQIIINLAVGLGMESGERRARSGEISSVSNEQRAMSSEETNDERRTKNNEGLQLSHESVVMRHEESEQKIARSGDTERAESGVHDSRLMTHDSKTLILDPFCGTGVVMQEAMLMDIDIYGSDIEPRMIQYTIDNLKWLDQKYPHAGDYRRIEVGDATKHKWHNSQNITSVAAETYLGQPLSTLPTSEHLSKIMYDVNLLHHKFLLNIHPQIAKGTRLCLAIPTWRGKHEFLHLPMLDHLTEMGYTRMRFTHVQDNNLIYHRENQVVARELLVIIKN